MNSREMHYDYKQKLNKIDSQKYRNLKVPEIDWKLQEAQELFVKMIAEPRVRSQFGFEMNQRTIDDVRTLVVNQTEESGTCMTCTKQTEDSYIAELPEDYWFLVSAKAIGTKGKCKNKVLQVRVKQHDDEDEVSPFDRSSFEWREVNIKFTSDGIRIFTDGTFEISKLCLNYIRRPKLIHNAQDYVNGTYTTLRGEVLTGSQDCELPEGTHREIVDLAVFITATDLGVPNIQAKQQKIKLNN